jgi:hypothetical protein
VDKALPKPVTFFKVVVKNNEQKWIMEKRFSQFDNLFKELKKSITNLPKLPAKTYFKMKAFEDLEKRRDELSVFMQACILRTDILNNPGFRDFLEVIHHSHFIIIFIHTLKFPSSFLIPN